MQSSEPKLSLISTIELAIELSAGDASPSKVRLHAADIDELITKLAHYRSTMTPEVPRAAPEFIASGRAVLDPMWLLHSPEGARHRLLVVRHPGLGWMVFQLPASEAAKLGHALLDGPKQPVGEPMPARHRHLH